MKTIVLSAILCTVIWSACTHKKTNTTTPKLVVNGVADTIIVTPGSMVQYSASPAATWRVSRLSAGSINQNGNFTAGTIDGTFYIVATNTLDQTDTVIRTVIVTKHAAIFNDMKKGGYLLSFRHAAASTGSDQTSSTTPNWWKLCDATLARQINAPLGYNQCDSTGYSMRLMQLPFDTTMTSEFCRCKQTAQYFNLGVPNKEYQELTYFLYDETNRYTNTMYLYATKPVTTKNYISVTHSGYAITPILAPLANLNWGDCAVFKLIAPGIAPTYLKTITVDDWIVLARR